jgi:translation initiation factor 5B
MGDKSMSGSSVIRKPIIAVLGHVDAGKTKVLDRIRGTAVAEKEAGGITQHIGATEVPIEVIMKISGPLIKRYGFDIKVNGLLFIDTPGHEAFTNLRKRGGSIADLAIVVVDVTKGLQEQAKEAISILKSYKTPFIVAANKIDRIMGWESREVSFTENIAAQAQDTQKMLDEKLYEIVAQLHKEGFASERFDRCGDFTKEIPIIPSCAKTGEGIPEILMFLAGLSQKYLEERLMIKVEGAGKATIMEVKEERGLGTTVDVILYDGSLKVGDTIILGGSKGPIKAKIRALLEPKALDEMRMPSEKFGQVNEVHAAAGVKICAPGLEGALAGSPLMLFTGEGDEKAIENEIENVKFESAENGVLVRADTLGSLEALVKLLEGHGIKVKSADIGEVTRKDVIELCAVREKEPDKAVIFAFNVRPNEAAAAEAAKEGIKIFEDKVVYSLLEAYDEWLEEQKGKEKEESLSAVTLPAKIKIMAGFIFRHSKPAIAGVKVLGGRLRRGAKLMKDEKVIGTVSSLQKEGKAIEVAKENDEVAASIDGAVIGRNVFENDTLYTYIPQADFAKMEKIKSEFTDAELALLNEIKEKELALKEVAE